MERASRTTQRGWTRITRPCSRRTRTRSVASTVESASTRIRSGPKLSAWIARNGPRRAAAGPASQREISRPSVSLLTTLARSVAEAGPDHVPVDRADPVRVGQRAAHLERGGARRLQVGERDSVEPAVVVGVGQNAGDPGLTKPVGRRAGLAREAGNGRRRRRLPSLPHRLDLAAEGIRRGGAAQGGDGPRGQPGGNPAHGAQSVLAANRACRWLSWFHRTRTIRGGPVKPVSGPT